MCILPGYSNLIFSLNFCPFLNLEFWPFIENNIVQFVNATLLKALYRSSQKVIGIVEHNVECAYDHNLSGNFGPFGPMLNISMNCLLAQLLLIKTLYRI